MQDTLISVEAITDIPTIKKLCKIRPAFKQHEADIIGILESSGALLKGHFQLLSGLHSEYFLRFSKISALSQNIEFLAKIICEAIQADGTIVDKVLSPDTAGVTLAYEVSKILHKTRIAAKTDHLNRPTKLINRVELYPSDRVLLVNDLSSTFTGLDKMMELVEDRRAQVSAIALLASRALDLDSMIPPGVKTYVVTDLFNDIHNYGSQTNDETIKILPDCEMCKQNPDINNIIPSWELN